MDEIHYRILKHVESNPEISQRELAQKLGVSLGKTNYCLKALVDVGWIKIRNFRNSENRLAYTYILTPQGIVGKATTTLQFLRWKLAEYEAIKAQIEELKSELREGHDGPEERGARTDDQSPRARDMAE